MKRKNLGPEPYLDCHLMIENPQKWVQVGFQKWFYGICKHISVNIKIVVYWPIYDIEYWPIYEIFQKSFFDRYMSEFIIFWPIYENFYFSKIGYFRLLHSSKIEKESYIDQYNNSYIGLYKNVYKTLGDLAYIDLYTPYRFAA